MIAFICGIIVGGILMFVFLLWGLDYDSPKKYIQYKLEDLKKWDALRVLEAVITQNITVKGTNL